MNSASLSAGFAGVQGLTALAYWITARDLHPAAFGRLVAYVGVAMLVASAADLGFDSWLIRELVRDDSNTKFATGLGVRIAIAVGVGGVWGLTGLVAWLAGYVALFVPLLGLWIVLSLVWSTLLVPRRAAEEMHRVAAVSVVERATLVIVVVAGGVAGAASLSLVLGLVFGALLATAVAWGSMDRSSRQVERPTVAEIRRFLGASLGFAASSVALQAQRLDVAIVGLIAGPHAAGIYGAPARLTNALGILPQAFSVSLFPRMSRGTGAIWTRELRSGIASLSAVMVLVTAPVFVFAGPLAVVFLGSDYRSSGSVLRVILVGMLLASVNQPIATTFQARGREHFVAKTVGLGSAAGLVAIAIGAWLDGPTGGAFGFVVLQVTILATLLAAAPDRAVVQRGAVGHAGL